MHFYYFYLIKKQTPNESNFINVYFSKLILKKIKYNKIILFFKKKSKFKKIHKPHLITNATIKSNYLEELYTIEYREGYKVLIRETMIFIKVMFGSRKILRKEKIAKENDFFMFGCPMKNIKENQI